MTILDEASQAARDSIARSWGGDNWEDIRVFSDFPSAEAEDDAYADWIRDVKIAVTHILRKLPSNKLMQIIHEDNLWADFLAEEILDDPDYANAPSVYHILLEYLADVAAMAY